MICLIGPSGFTLFEIIEYQTSILTFKSINGTAPDYLQELFSANNYNMYNLRRSISDVIVKRHLHNIKATSTFILQYNALIQTLQRSPNHE